MKRNLMWLLGAALVSGCATQAPLFPPEQYLGYARGWVGMERCAEKGYMDVNTVVLGRQQVQRFLNKFRYDPALIDRTIRGVRQDGETVTKAECVEAAIAFQQMHQDQQRRVANNRAHAADMQQAVDSLKASTQQTYCNKLGDQVFCSKY